MSRKQGYEAQGHESAILSFEQRKLIAENELRREKIDIKKEEIELKKS